MKRIVPLAGAVLALCSLAPARAGTDVSGFVRAPAAAPNAQRVGSITGSLPNGTLGYVVELPSSATNKRYELTLTGGATTLEDLDVFFYYGLDGLGDPCPIARDVRQAGSTETGTACPTSGDKRVRYAIVVLNAGALAEFSLRV